MHGHRSVEDRSLHSPMLRPVYDVPNPSVSDQVELQPASSTSSSPPRRDIPPEISELTGDEARRALAVGIYSQHSDASSYRPNLQSLLQSLSLPLCYLPDETARQAGL